MQPAIQEKARQAEDAEVDLMQLLNHLWAGRRVILAAGLAFMLLGFVGAKLLNQYRAEGIFIFGGGIPYQAGNALGIAPADFKRISAAYLSEDHFNAYVEEAKQQSLPEVQALQGLFKKKNSFEEHVAPIYKISKQDAKDVIGIADDKVNSVIGLRLSYQSETAEAARKQVEWLAQYAIDSLLYANLSDRIRDVRQELELKKLQLTSGLQISKRTLEIYKQRSQDLARIEKKFPNASRGAGRQMISVTEETAKYLPPQNLLATNEMSISRMNEDIRNARLELARIDQMLKYYAVVAPLFQQTVSGKVLLAGLVREERALFDGAKQSDDVSLEVRNQFKIDNQAMELLYLKKSRIVSMQVMPTARPVRTAGMALMLGLMLAAMLVLLKRPLQQ